MYLNIFLILLYLIIYLISPIKFSNKKILNKINYNTTFFYLFNIIILIELFQLFQLYPKLKYWIIIPYIFLYAILDIINQPVVIKDESLNLPPKYLSKSYVIHIIVIIVIIVSIYNSKNYAINYLNILNILNIIIFLILLIIQSKYKPCKYNLPDSWYKL